MSAYQNDVFKHDIEVARAGLREFKAGQEATRLQIARTRAVIGNSLRLIARVDALLDRVSQVKIASRVDEQSL
jgi:hypothetical protein